MDRTHTNGDPTIAKLISWFESHGGSIHPSVVFNSPNEDKESKYYGYSAFTTADLPTNTAVITCPFDLVITVESARDALQHYCSIKTDDTLSENQVICTYICLHWIIPEDENGSSEDFLRHRPYIQSLTPVAHLCTPHYFSEVELELFRGTNLYGATISRRENFQAQWMEILSHIPPEKQHIANQITWDNYLAAATYLTSRSFPSTLLSPNPSLINTSASYPILIPVIDFTNHSRGHPVTWEISRMGTSSDGYCISLKENSAASAGSELFNNYGPKPNSSLILGYGFSLENNPDDTIILKIGGEPTHGAHKLSHEIGRNAANVDGLWASIRSLVEEGMRQDGGGTEEPNATLDIEVDLQSCEILTDMVNDLINRLPQQDLESIHETASIRREVLTMWKIYVRGQREILSSLLEWANEKEREVMRLAEESGIQFMTDEESEET